MMNDKAKDLEKVSFGIAVMFAVYWIYTYAVKQYLPFSENFKTAGGLAVLYVIGILLFSFITHKIPVHKYERKKISFKTVMLSFWQYNYTDTAEDFGDSSRDLFDDNNDAWYNRFSFIPNQQEKDYS